MKNSGKFKFLKIDWFWIIYGFLDFIDGAYHFITGFIGTYFVSNSFESLIYSIRKRSKLIVLCMIGCTVSYLMPTFGLFIVTSLLFGVTIGLIHCDRHMKYPWR